MTLMLEGCEENVTENKGRRKLKTTDLIRFALPTAKMVTLQWAMFVLCALIVLKSRETTQKIPSSYHVIPKEAESLTEQDLADYVNKKQNFFTAARSNFSAKSRKAKLMDLKYVGASTNTPELIIRSTIPSSFDSRTYWRYCQSISEIRDQSDCGSCWAFAAVESMSDRICIFTAAQTQVTLSADDVLSCCGSTCGSGCGGGYPIQAWNYWVQNGICTGGSYISQTGCKPYPIPPCGQVVNGIYYGACPSGEYSTPPCTYQCRAGYSIPYSNDKYYGRSAYNVAPTESGIQKEIMTNGPVEASFTVYDDFYQYTGGIYVHTGGAQLGGHAVKIIGWGSSYGTPYWIIANSWGYNWGENGFFRMLRGENECGIEQSVVAGLPNI